MEEYLIGVLKEVREPPVIIKIKKSDEYLKCLLGGEYTTFDYDDYTILYNKDYKNLTANVYINTFSKTGETMKGTLFAVAKDNKGNLISLNWGQAQRCKRVFEKESMNYKNFDENGRYIPRKKRNKTKKKNKNSSFVHDSNIENKQLIKDCLEDEPLVENQIIETFSKMTLLMMAFIKKVTNKK